MYTYSKYGHRSSARTDLSSTPAVDSKYADKETSRGKPKEKEIKKAKTEPSVSLPRGANPKSIAFSNDFSNDFVHTRQPSTQYIRNVDRPTEGYPKLQKLKDLKQKQVDKHAVKPYGVRVDTNKIVPLLNSWVKDYTLQFDVIMIGALVENQFLLPLLELLPLYNLCAKPGFLFIWTHTANIKQLSSLLNSDKWNKKFRRSEELVFVPVDEKQPLFSWKG